MFNEGDLVKVREEAIADEWVRNQVRNHGWLWLVVGVSKGGVTCKSIATGHTRNEAFFVEELEKADA